MRALLKAGAKKIYVGARKLDAIEGAARRGAGQAASDRARHHQQGSDRGGARAAKDVTLLVNNGGVNFNTPLFAIESSDNARREMEVNYFGTLAMCRGVPADPESATAAGRSSTCCRSCRT